jgi:hypothetical protein
MGVALYLLGLVPAITQHVIPRWIYWLAALVCVFIAFYRSWSEEYDRAELCKRELEEIYADVVLDWLLTHHPKTFPAAEVARLMKYDEYKVIRGLKMLEKEFKVVRDDGAAGWFFDIEKAFRLGLICNLSRLIPPPKG